MMREKLTYTNERGESIEFSVRSPYHVNVAVDVTGLYDRETELYTVQMADADGETETGFSVPARDMEIVGDIPEHNAEALREKIRHMLHVLSPYAKGTLTCTAGDASRLIDVRPEVNPKITRKLGGGYPQFSISLKALVPYWRDSAETVTAISAFVGAVEWPDDAMCLQADDFEMESRVENPIIVNAGDAPCGMIIEIETLLDSLFLASLSRKNGDDERTVTFRTAGTSLIRGEKAILNTIPGQKDFTILWATEARTAASSSVDLAKIDFEATEWMQLLPGDNEISFVTTSLNKYRWMLNITARHTNLYSGV